MSFVEGLLWLTLNIYHEARSEDEVGQLAVAHVTINRSKEKDLPIKEVVLQPYQFSWTLKDRSSWYPRNPEAFVVCLNSAFSALFRQDFTKGATFYHRQDIKPYWSDSVQLVGVYGSHKFYRRQ